MFCVDSFYFFWVLMELRTLVFIGLSYSVFKNNFSSLLRFFIIQTISALLIFIFYCLGVNLGFTLSLVLKLSMFPFYFWYLNLVNYFPNFIFYFTRTFFKIPSILILEFFSLNVNLNVLLTRGVFTILVGGVLIVFRNDLRFIILASSVANNSWFILSQIASLHLFILFLFFYRFFLFFILNSVSNSSSFKHKFSSNISLFILRLCVLAGMPPFPIFFVKILVIVNIIFRFLSNMFFLFFLLSNVVLVLGYLKIIFNFLMLQFKASFILRI